MTTQAPASTSFSGPWWKEPTKQQWISYLSAWFGWVLDSFDFCIFLFVALDIAKEFNVAPWLVHGSLTLTLLMRLLGGVAAGWASDKWGRKLPFLLSMVWFAIFDGLVALAPSIGTIILFRTLFGFGMGAEWSSGTTLAMENWPQRTRRVASGVLQGSWAIGFCLAALANWLVTPVWGWRALFVIAAIPALLVLPMRYWVPESQEWLAHKVAGTTAKLRDLLQPTLLKNLLWSSLTAGFGFCVYYALIIFHAPMLQLEFKMTPYDVFILTLLFNVGFFVGCVICGFLAQRFNITLAIVLPALLGIPMLWLFVGKVEGMLSAGAFLAGAISVGWSGTTPALLTGLYPARLRALCAGITYQGGAFCAALIPTIIGLLHDGGRSYGDSIFWVAAICEVGLVLGLVLRRPERLQEQNAQADAKQLAATTGSELPKAIKLQVES
jgi:MFS transporter, SHS family, lactate transporter